MATRQWNLSLEGKQHEILLKHGAIPGREIWLDGRLIEKGRINPDNGSEHYFEIDGIPAEVGIVSHTFGFEYYLRINDEFVFPDSDSRQTVGKATKNKLAVRQNWIALGQSYGLESHPSKVGQFVYSPRLIGYRNGYLVVIFPGFRQANEASIPGMILVLKHADIDLAKRKEITK